MFPVQDLNPTRRMPIFTWGLIIINVLVFLWEMSMSPEQLNSTFLDITVVPRNISAAPAFY